MIPWREHVFVIGEIGVNHNGDMKLAKELIDIAKRAGCDAVKFQTFKSEELATSSAKLASYQAVNTNANKNQTQLELLKKLELSFDNHRELKIHAEKNNLMFLSTGFDITSLEFLKELQIPIWKIPSGEITNYPLLRFIGKESKPILLSTGMATIAEISDAVDTLLHFGARRDEMCILHCNTEYPTPIQDVNLSAMPKLGMSFGTDYGYSDHTIDSTVSIGAVALGARVIEKHFTKSRKLAGPDHKASLEPDELIAMVKAIREMEIALGSQIKAPTKSELKNREIARKSIVAAMEINEGDTFTESNITVKRPATGINPMRWKEVIGRKSAKKYLPDQEIEW